jgi:pantoate--beta-alanine ligase
MQQVSTVSEMRQLADNFRREGKRVALVPTQGAIHAGQDALIREAVARADVVVVSIFVNPLQFPANEPVSKYPRSLTDDLQRCADGGAHFVFTPSAEEIYPRGYSTYLTEEAVAKPLDGASRPTHFRGVTTVKARLFNIIRPDLVVLGQKAAQRVAVVRKMIADLGWAIEVVVVPTVREADGLAVGVPNRNFTPTQRQESLALIESLRKAKSMTEAGVRSPDRVIAEVTHILGQHRRIRIIYIAIVDPKTMEPMREIVPGRSLLMLAVWLDEVRLIDNIEL